MISPCRPRSILHGLGAFAALLSLCAFPSIASAQLGAPKFQCSGTTYPITTVNFSGGCSVSGSTLTVSGGGGGGGVTSLTAGGGVTVSSATGAVTLGSSCGGDLAGTVSSAVVGGLQGRPVSNAAPAVNKVLGWTSSVIWEPVSVVNSLIAGTGITVSAATGAVTVSLTGTIPTTFAGTPQTYAGQVTFFAPAATDNASIAAAQTFSNGTPLALATTTPKTAQRLNVHLTDANSSVSSGTITIVGVISTGETVTDTVTIGSFGTQSKQSNYTFLSITSITPSGYSGNTGVDTFGVGYDSSLGLPIPLNATNVQFNRVNRGSVPDGFGVFSTTYMWVAPSTPTDGTANYQVWYSYQITPSGTLM